MDEKIDLHKFQTLALLGNRHAFSMAKFSSSDEFSPSSHIFVEVRIAICYKSHQPAVRKGPYPRIHTLSNVAINMLSA
jgi:hypothetical protein